MLKNTRLGRFCGQEKFVNLMNMVVLGGWKISCLRFMPMLFTVKLVN